MGCFGGVCRWGVSVGCIGGVYRWGVSVGCIGGVYRWGVSVGCGEIIILLATYLEIYVELSQTALTTYISIQ